MQDKETTTNITKDLQTANKYIFVQDFVKAEEILKNICQNYENEYEIYFRRVEIAVKSNRLDELLLDLLEHEKLSPDSDAIKLAYLLAKFKKCSMDRKKQEAKEDYNKNIDILFSNYDKVVPLPNKKMKVHRSIYVPDDIVQMTESEQLNLNQSFDFASFDELVEKIFNYYKENQENYAACYVAGCAMDNLGNLEEAVHKWKKALLLNPSSICTLSILAELQQQGHFHEHTDDFCLRLESLDRYLVHGHIETHTDLYNDFINLGDYKNAIASLKILSDWIYRQYGSVPIEIELVCLLGSMNAYKLDGNLVAAESSKNEVENIVIAYKKSTKDLKHLVFIAELCEEYDLKNIAKICYFSILTSKNVDIQTIKEVSTHCITHYATAALLECLKNSYENNPGNPEIRFYILLCSLHLKDINVVDYMDIKKQIRELIYQNDTENALRFLEEIILKFAEDPETHYYLAEIYTRKGFMSKAQFHFEIMYTLDKYNIDAIVKYIYFLLRNKFYSQTIDIAQQIVEFDMLSVSQKNEIRWSLAAAYFADEKYELARVEILKSLANEPWNISYISLHLRCCLHLMENSSLADALLLVTRLEEFCLQYEKISLDNKDKLLQGIIDYSLLCMRNGFFEIAWSFAKSALIIAKKLEASVSELLSKTAAAYLSSVAIPQLLALQTKQRDFDAPFFEIAGCIAKTYSYTGQWRLVDEWLSLAQNSALPSKKSQSMLFELEALSIAMQGTDFKKAQNILEAAIDCYENREQIPMEIKILHGYLLVSQGQIAAGVEKMNNSMNENLSIQSLYFFIKGIERAGKISTITKDSIEQMCRNYPLNNFEQKMVEEIFYTVSSKIELIPLGLAC